MHPARSRRSRWWRDGGVLAERAPRSARRGDGLAARLALPPSRRPGHAAAGPRHREVFVFTCSGCWRWPALLPGVWAGDRLGLAVIVGAVHFGCSRLLARAVPRVHNPDVDTPARVQHHQSGAIVNGGCRHGLFTAPDDRKFVRSSQTDFVFTGPGGAGLLGAVGIVALRLLLWRTCGWPPVAGPLGRLVAGGVACLSPSGLRNSDDARLMPPCSAAVVSYGGCRCSRLKASCCCSTCTPAAARWPRLNCLDSRIDMSVLLPRDLGGRMDAGSLRCPRPLRCLDWPSVSHLETAVAALGNDMPPCWAGRSGRDLGPHRVRLVLSFAPAG